MESYFELLFCFILNVISWTRASSVVDFLEFFSGFSNILCSIICLVYGICIIVFPIHGLVIIIKYKDILQEDNIKKDHEYLYDGLRTKKFSTSLFNIVFLFRRIYTVIILVFLTDYPCFQCLFLMIGALIDLIK